jgi:TolB-like protein/Tfp pilus assembly protein PilF
MSSIIEGYSYDIFISYRQKDNKYDGWVTEFVENLKKELEATFKEVVTVYFDINPHDGLLETHDVDASLKEKLKCLVFIPVISRTYCDPKSFAWEYEFKKFIEEASHDQFGLKVNLPNGNVANRVLPVRIHELETNDLKLCESVLGGVIRGVDFVYRSAGVNRPLRTNEDYLQNNLNKICYRDQINKVANALDEIIHSLQIKASGPEEEKNLPEEIKTSSKIKNEKTKGVIRSIHSQKTNKRFLLFLISLLCIGGIVLIYNFFNKAEDRKSLAFLPFRGQGNDSALISCNDFLNEVAMIKLHKIKSLILRPRISTSQYKDTEKPLNTIRKELNVTYIVDGNIRREGGKILIWVGLIDAKDNKQLWSEEFIWENNQISAIVSEITKNIAYACNVDLSTEELKQIVSDPTRNGAAYLNYISANVLSNYAWNFFNTENVVMDSAGFRKAIGEYDNAIISDPAFAEAYARRAIARSWGYFTGQFDTTYIARCLTDINKALEIDKDLPDAQIALGFYYLLCNIDYQKALVHFNRAAAMDPENFQPLFYMALVYRRMGDWGKSQSLISRVIQQNPQVPLFLTNIGLSYEYLHKFDSALIYHQKAIDIVPSWAAPHENKIETLILKDGNTSKARKALEIATRNTGKGLGYLRIQLNIYDGRFKEALYETDQTRRGEFWTNAERYLTYAKIYSFLNNRKTALMYYDSALVSLNVISKDQKIAMIHSLTSIAYAGTENKTKALEEGVLAVDLAIKNKMDESEMKLIQAQVYTMIGDYDNAIINIEYLLENPSCFSVGLLQLDPVWKPLLNIPEVKTLIKKYSEKNKF